MQRSFLLDTCTLIDLDVVDLGEFADGLALVSAVTIGELAYGLDIGEASQRAARAHLLEDTLATYEVLSYGVEEAKLYGVLATLVRAAGRNPRPRRLDLQIAATAAAARLPLLTCNPDDFRGVERLVDVVAVGRPA
ncbi:PIN domain-containing protein [Pseudonocardia nigra]|uniref:PIN domain-containing protein n=1 Tax=Pseudonocardia nigra TaxID=1921578 RepID=UPI001C5EFBBE|nr:PIN domain-containing protein [Pseudonocardia nigra]